MTRASRYTTRDREDSLITTNQTLKKTKIQKKERNRSYDRRVCVALRDRRKAPAPSVEASKMAEVMQARRSLRGAFPFVRTSVSLALAVPRLGRANGSMGKPEPEKERDGEGREGT